MGIRRTIATIPHKISRIRIKTAGTEISGGPLQIDQIKYQTEHFPGSCQNDGLPQISAAPQIPKAR